MTSNETFVIARAGLAGAKAAESLVLARGDVMLDGGDRIHDDRLADAHVPLERLVPAARRSEP